MVDYVIYKRDDFEDSDEYIIEVLNEGLHETKRVQKLLIDKGFVIISTYGKYITCRKISDEE